ncbi:hypothetical protein [Burkholderia ubonensis]|uniref:hypothetical protein n=1 Tax=Burkholderia ubonensis TaxID=101571 RepID=UPI000759DA1B|nr:hypothetical protein [Burkholderia ubonensis]KWK75797.1 hypothetical protein WM15_29835 [Burkholderia ubonensis]
MAENASTRAGVEERLRAGDRRFSKLEQRINQSDESMKAHLQLQDEKIDAIVASVSQIQSNTQSMVDTWEGGARVVRALCRAADAWRFLVKHVAGPTLAFGTAGAIVFRYLRHEPVPDWAHAVLKILLG